jgi:GNAT superfamily N-acetyltransferase
MATRAKQKKAQLRQETETLNKKRAQLEECKAIEDAMTIVPMFKKFDRNGIKSTFLSMKKCPEELEEFTFNVIENHLKTLYEETWGWEGDEKAAELYDSSARFLFAVPDVDPPEPFGFVHYRFELDRTETALYIYDIHVRDDVMGKGLGKALLQTLEFLALKLRLDAVIVTILKANTQGMGFFGHMKYVQHASSPSVQDPESAHEYHQEVLYKSLVKKAASQ